MIIFNKVLSVETIFRFNSNSGDCIPPTVSLIINEMHLLDCILQDSIYMQLVFYLRIFWNGIVITYAKFIKWSRRTLKRFIPSTYLKLSFGLTAMEEGNKCFFVPGTLVKIDTICTIPSDCSEDVLRLIFDI